MKTLIAFLVGVLITLVALTARDIVRVIDARLDRIEQYLSQQEMQRQLHVLPQSHEGELNKPQQWKV